MKKINLDAVKYDNYLLNQQEIRDKKIILKSKPLSLVFNITGNCQLQCIMCPADKKRDINLSFEYISKVIKLFGNELISLQWIGGEPTIHPDFVKMLSYSNQFNLMQTITTNGLLVKGEIAKKLIKYNADITISIDGSTKELYESIRIGANFETLVNNIKNLNKLRKKYNHQGHFGINFCIMEQNYKDLINMVHFAEKHLFQDIYVIKVKERCCLNEQEDIKFKKIFFAAQQEADKNGINFLGWTPFGTRKQTLKIHNFVLSCYVPFFNLVVEPDGHFEACVCNELLLKKTNKKKDYFAIWNCKEIQKYRKNIYNKKLPGDICSNCSLIGLRASYHPQIVSKLEYIKKILKEG